MVLEDKIQEILGDDYVVKGTVGQGSFFVHLVEYKSTELRAVKYLSKDQERKVRKSTGIQGKLDHPNLVKLYDIKNGCLIMEYVDGKTLEQACQDTPLDQHLVINILYQICDGLKYLHNKEVGGKIGLSHGDIKPENILLSTEGEIKITDFSCSGHTRITKPTGCTFEYASPEQIHTMRPSRSGDIYSLGATIYTLLTSNEPFANAYKNIENDEEKKLIILKIQEKISGKGTLKQILNTKGISDGMIEIIEKCMQFEPANRYQSIDELLCHMRELGFNKPEKKDQNKVASDSYLESEIENLFRKINSSYPKLYGVSKSHNEVLNLLDNQQQLHNHKRCHKLNHADLAKISKFDEYIETRLESDRSSIKDYIDFVKDKRNKKLPDPKDISDVILHYKKLVFEGWGEGLIRQAYKESDNGDQTTAIELLKKANIFLKRSTITAKGPKEIIPQIKNELYE
jgi:serine/threonine protein kinase